jgi:hypothetical protein
MAAARSASGPNGAPMASGFGAASTIGLASGYFGPVIVALALMASGLAFVSAPSTATILANVPPAKAGGRVGRQRRVQSSESNRAALIPRDRGLS